MPKLLRQRGWAILGVTVLGLLVAADLIFQPAWAERLRDWSGAAAALGILILTGLYVRSTADMATATRQLAEEAAKQRESLRRPRVLVLLDLPRYNLVELVVENLGEEPAEEVRIGIDPALTTKGGEEVASLPFFREGARALAPRQAIRFFVGTYQDFIAEGGDAKKSTSYVAQVEYRSPDGRDFDERHHLDLNAWHGSLMQREDPLESMSGNLKKLADRFDRARSAFSQGILVVSDTESRDLLENWKASKANETDENSAGS